MREPSTFFANLLIFTYTDTLYPYKFKVTEKTYTKEIEDEVVLCSCSFYSLHLQSQ